MTAFDKKVNQIATRHRWNIEKQARAAVPCYIIAAPTYEDRLRPTCIEVCAPRLPVHDLTPPDTLTGRTAKRPDPIHPAPPGRTTTKSERKYLP